MHSNSSGGSPERFFAGKGFYIVLFLCAAVVGISSWMMAAGKKTMENSIIANNAMMDSRRVETVIITPAPTEKAAPAMAQGSIAAKDEQETPDAVPVFAEEQPAYEPPSPVWPVMGEVERGYDMQNLSYDPTLRDWRTHNGIDICAAMGEEVVATRAGMVESIEEDSLYGVVLTLNHDDGSYSIYASLSPETAVSVGEWVEQGRTLGYVGGTAICETAQTAHLHYSVIDGGEYADPADYLPG